MKSLKLRLLAVLIGTVLTLGLSHVVAQASCPQYEGGGTVYGEFECSLTNYCNGWCYYHCSCRNLFPGYSCNDVLREAGFELVDAPQC
jgi:hypothetical protein